MSEGTPKNFVICDVNPSTMSSIIARHAAENPKVKVEGAKSKRISYPPMRISYPPYANIQTTLCVYHLASRLTEDHLGLGTSMV
jgi:hypothetical protein